MFPLSTDTQAVLLLCARLGQRNDSVRPLNTRQYATVAKWLFERSLRPADLLRDEGRAQMGEFISSDISRELLGQLLDRGTALALMTERWASGGIWVVSRGDSGYPTRIKSYLQQGAPPLFFGVGDQELLQRGGIAVVGSRHANEEDLMFAREIGAACASQQISVISGAAKGVDIESMMAAVDGCGTSIGVLAEGLGRASVAGRYHDAITEGRLVLVSPFDPESRWFAHLAMDRNKLVYGLSDVAVVVSCTDGQGGTWAGAIEAIKHSRTPVYVKASGSASQGNSHLIQLGAQSFPAERWNSLRSLFERPPVAASLFDRTAHPERSNESQSSGNEKNGEVRDSVLVDPAPEATAIAPDDEALIAKNEDSNDRNLPVLPVNEPNAYDAYSCVQKLFLDLLKVPMDERSVSEALLIIPAQAKVWLKRAVEDGTVRRLSKPIRYVAAEPALLFTTRKDSK